MPGTPHALWPEHQHSASSFSLQGLQRQTRSHWTMLLKLHEKLSVDAVQDCRQASKSARNQWAAVGLQLPGQELTATPHAAGLCLSSSAFLTLASYLSDHSNLGTTGHLSMKWLSLCAGHPEYLVAAGLT